MAANSVNGPGEYVSSPRGGVGMSDVQVQSCFLLTSESLIAPSRSEHMFWSHSHKAFFCAGVSVGCSSLFGCSWVSMGSVSTGTAMGARVAPPHLSG